MATTHGDLRIPHYIPKEGIEITCIVCGAYSAHTEMANQFGGWKIPLQVLEKTPYICRCGTEYSTRMQDNHWHLQVKIPENIINQETLDKIIKAAEAKAAKAKKK